MFAVPASPILHYGRKRLLVTCYGGIPAPLMQVEQRLSKGSIPVLPKFIGHEQHNGVCRFLHVMVENLSINDDRLNDRLYWDWSSVKRLGLNLHLSALNLIGARPIS